MKRQPSNIVTLPRAVQHVKRVYVTSTGGDLGLESIALVFAWCVRIDGTADAVRRAARRMRDMVCREHKPTMSLLMREQSDAKVLSAVCRVIDATMEVWPPAPGSTAEQRLAWQEARVSGPFPQNPPPEPEPEPVPPPRCHMKPMKMAGYHRHRHWRCQHCTHTKPLRECDEPTTPVLQDARPAGRPVPLPALRISENDART